MARSVYAVHPGVAMVQNAIVSLPGKTGRALDEWVACKTIVPLYRTHVFAQIKPTTRTRIDRGLALRETRAPARLIDTGGFKNGDRITHRVEISAMSDIDADVMRWLKQAYAMDA